MRVALELARTAATHGEIPIGSVIVRSSADQEWEIVASASNLKECAQDPLGHAEVLAIKQAAAALGRWRLSGCELYVTLEPCTMCAGAIIHSRLDRVIYGAVDPKAGAVESLYRILSDPRMNHAPKITAGTLALECANELSAFFRRLRSKAGDRSEHKISARP